MTGRAKDWLKSVWKKSSEEKPKHTNLISRKTLLKRLERGPEARAEFVSSHVDNTIAFQLRTIRENQGLSQAKLGEMVGTNQNAISRLESGWYGRPTVSTLKKLAAALDVALVVRFVPFSQLVDWISGTPFIDNGMSSASLAVPSFARDVFDTPEPATVSELEHSIGLFNAPAPGMWMSKQDFHLMLGAMTLKAQHLEPQMYEENNVSLVFSSSSEKVVSESGASIFLDILAAPIPEITTGAAPGYAE